MTRFRDVTGNTHEFRFQAEAANRAWQDRLEYKNPGIVQTSGLNAGDGSGLELSSLQSLLALCAALFVGYSFYQSVHSGNNNVDVTSALMVGGVTFLVAAIVLKHWVSILFISAIAYIYVHFNP